MRQVSKQGFMAAQVEGWDEAPATIKGKEAPLRGEKEIGQKKKIKGNKKLCNRELSNI